MNRLWKRASPLDAPPRCLASPFQRYADGIPKAGSCQPFDHSAGIAVIKVNPAYTSLIGLLAHRDQFESVHLAASFIIARRALDDGLAHQDQQITLTQSLKGDSMDALLASISEDKAPADVLALPRVRARLSEACKQQWKAKREAIKRWRQSLRSSQRRQAGELLTQLAL